MTIEEMYCPDCDEDVAVTIEDAAVRGTADVVPVYVCSCCDETICECAEVEE